jgi:hypothetical protein
MTAADVHQLTDEVREKMLATLKEISTPSPEARIVPSTGDAEGSEDGEEQPLIGRSSGVYGSHDEGMRRRGSSRGSSASSVASRREMVETGAVDARGLARDLGEAVGAAGAAGGAEGTKEGEGEGEAETEDEIDETGAVLVKKPE